MAAQFEPIIGRYLTLDLGGRAHRVYFEEAGQGIPLVCLHTAGADGRQFRHLMVDAEITRHRQADPASLPNRSRAVRSLILQAGKKSPKKSREGVDTR